MVGLLRSTAKIVSFSRVLSTSVGGAASALASGSKVGWLRASDSA